MIAIPLAYGDIFDKLTILEIKLVRLSSLDASSRVSNELQVLREALLAGLPDWSLNEALTPLLNDLRSINSRLWNLENLARDTLTADGIGTSFATATAEILGRNEERAAVKRRINLLLESPLCEEKEYSSSAANYARSTQTAAEIEA